MEKIIRQLLVKYDGAIPREELISILNIDLVEKINRSFKCNIHQKSRMLQNVKGRALYSFIMREKGKTLQQIGYDLDLNHATVINSLEVHNNYYDTDKEYKTIADHVIKNQYEVE